MKILERLSIAFWAIVVAASAPLPAFAAGAAPLKFMTFNIWTDAFGNPVSEREAGVEAAMLKLKPDVISLQEVSINWWKSPIFRHLKAAGYGIIRGDFDEALQRANWTGRKPEWLVNAEPLLYRKETLNLIDLGMEFFHVNLQAAKCVTWAVFEEKRTKRRFVAFATHFWWQHNGKESDTIRELNARHVLLLLRDIRRKWGENLPAILGGDLNSNEKSIAHAMLRSGGFANAASTAPVRSPHCSHHGDPQRGEDGKLHGSLRPAAHDRPERSLDYIYCTKGIRALRHEIITDQYVLDVSDHSPVVAEFAVEAE